MIALCTLYDSNFLNRGLALYESIERYTRDYVMYVLAMDDKCFDILSEMELPRMIPIRLSDFETGELRAVKDSRSWGEYCWTCKAPLIKYALERSGLEYCAYLDSDLYFYGDPVLLINEMEAKNASVLLVGHRFNRFVAKEKEFAIGKYCAGTLVFRNDDAGCPVLAKWEAQCLECCACLNDGIHNGDQKYLDSWMSGYDAVIETENMGAGVASWNLAQYRLTEEDAYGPVRLRYKGTEYNTLFYHYHALSFTAPRKVRTFALTAWGASKRLLDSFYVPYLRHLEELNKLLREKYNLELTGPKGTKAQAASAPGVWSRVARKLSMAFSFPGLRFLLFEDLPTKYYWKQDEVSF